MRVMGFDIRDPCCYTWFWALKATLTPPELGFFPTVLSSRWTIQAQMVSKILHTCSKFFTLGRANNILEAGVVSHQNFKSALFFSGSKIICSVFSYYPLGGSAQPQKLTSFLKAHLLWCFAIFSLILTIYVSKSIC